MADHAAAAGVFSAFDQRGVLRAMPPCIGAYEAQISTTTTITSSGSPSVFAQMVTFTVSVGVVAPGAGTPTGTVTFMDGSTPLATVTLDGSGQATFSTAALAIGTHTITATYSGEGDFVASTSAALSQTVLSARQELGLIIDQVTTLVANGVLDTGNGTALIAKLNAAISSLNNGNTIAGDNQMNAFIHQTNALLKSGKLASSDAETLISDIDLAVAAALADPF